MMQREIKVIAGPCAAESEEQVLRTAHQLMNIGITVFRAGVWKPRTKPGCFEGCGEKSLPWLQKVKEMGMSVAVEVATAEHVRLALQYGIDMMWVGARTTADPFAVQHIADALASVTDKSSVTVLVKNPVNPDVELWIGAVQRIKGAGIGNVIAVHRGFSSYINTQYRNQPMWQVPMEFCRRMADVPMYCDPSHLSGRSEMVAEVAQQALDLGFDGLMIESHSSPQQALSDARQQLTPDELREVLSSLVVKDNTNVTGLEMLRNEIDALDEELLNVIARRMQICREIGQYKKEHNISIFQSNRYAEILRRLTESGQERGIAAECTQSVVEAIHKESVRQQMGN